MGLGAAVAAAAGFTGAAATVVAIAVNFVVSTVLSVVLQSFTSKPKGAEFDLSGFQREAAGRTENTRQPISPWEIVYGEVRKGGIVTYEESTLNNNYYHRIVTLAAHPCTAVLAYYLNDEVVYPDQLDANGLVQVGSYALHIRIQMDLGTTGAQPFPDLVADSEGKWTDAHRQEGRTKVYVRYQFDRIVFAKGIPKISVRLRGKSYTDTRSAALGYGTNVSQVINDYCRTAKAAGGFGVLPARINETVLNASSNIDDELVAVAAGQAHNVTAVSTDNNTLDFGGTFCKFISGDVGQFTTSGTLPAGLSLATDYFIDVVRERSSTTAAIRLRVATSLANLRAGTFVDITGAGTGTHTLSKTKEPRYTANGVLLTDAEPAKIFDDLKSAFGGRVLYVGGKWLIKSGAYETPTIGFDEDDMVGPISVQTKISRAERFNQVTGLFVSPLRFDKPDEYPIVSDATYTANDGGEVLEVPLDLPWTNRFAMAQRLATLELQRHRREVTVEAPVNMRGFLVTGGDIIKLSNARLGFVDQPFEVADWRFESTGEAERPTYRVVLGLRQIDANVFAYSTSGEIVQPPTSITSLPNPFEVQPATGLLLESGTGALFTKADGTVVSRLKISWTASIDGLLSAHRVEYKKSSDPTYTKLPETPEPQSEIFIFEVEDGVAYDVRVVAIGYFGGESDPLEALNHIIVGKTEAPSTPTGFTIKVDADGTRNFSFDLVADADVRAGGGYEIRYFLGATSDYSAMSPLNTGVLVSSPFESNQLAAGTYTFAIKAVDSSGNVSATAAFISSAVIGDPRVGNVLFRQDERGLVWPGTKTDGFVDLGVLRATGAQTWADLPATWSALAATWDQIVTSNSPMVYETAEIDLTAAALDVTFRPLVSATATGTATITMQTGTHADGGVTGSFVALDTVTARYVKIRVSVAGATPVLSELVTLIDSPSKTEDFDDIDTSAATAGLFERIATGHFKIGTKGGISVITQAQITALQNVGAGYSWELISKTASLTSGGTLAAEFKIYNSSGTLADATVDILLRGVKAT